jgi:hypothetical protein
MTDDTVMITPEQTVEERVETVIAAVGYGTVSQIARKTGISYPEVHRTLRTLRTRRRIFWNGVWRPVITSLTPEQVVCAHKTISYAQGAARCQSCGRLWSPDEFIAWVQALRAQIEELKGLNDADHRRQYPHGCASGGKCFICHPIQGAAR